MRHNQSISSIGLKPKEGQEASSATIRSLSRKSPRYKVASQDKRKKDLDRSLGQRPERLLRRQAMRGNEGAALDGGGFKPKKRGDETLSSKSPTHSQLLSIKKSTEQGASKIPISQKISSFISKNAP